MKNPRTIALALIFLISLSKFDLSKASGFSIDLIHRDSRLSPSFNSSLTHPERVAITLLRSFSRVKNLALKCSDESETTDITPEKGAYVIKMEVGTPPVETIAIADTGSDLTWIQCKPCENCFKQAAPLFDPQKSSSYKIVSCESKTCGAIPRTFCEGGDRDCSYTQVYGDRSFSVGNIATETIKLGTQSIHNFLMGCGEYDQGNFGPESTGILGLGGGAESLVSQINSSIRGKFSYCLVPLYTEKKSSGKMNFGENGIVWGPGVVSTRFVYSGQKTFYRLTLKGVSVGNEKSGCVGSVSEGNIIIDSGTTLTFLPRDMYDEVEAAVKRQVKLKEVPDPSQLLNLCFESESKGDSLELPEMTAHFEGADVVLKPVNTFVKISEAAFCLAFSPSSDFSIWGNLAQANFLVGYDLENKTVSFKSTVCDDN